MKKQTPSNIKVNPDEFIPCNSCITYNICKDFGQFSDCRKGNRKKRRKV